MKRTSVVPMVFFAVLAVPQVARAHGWVTSPPSRQELCARGKVQECGDVQYEPQSVEAPKGAMSCSGGSRFKVLDDEGKGWPATAVGTSISVSWKLTAAHRTTTWLYYVDGRLHQTFDQGNQQPPAQLSHTLTNLPRGRHKLLAIWNIGDTPMAFYSCLDLQVGEGGAAPPAPPPPETPPPVVPPPATPPPAVPPPATPPPATPPPAVPPPATPPPATPPPTVTPPAVPPPATSPPTVPPPATPPQVVNPPVTPTPPAPSSGPCENGWTAASVYTGGVTVSHEGQVFRARWWTRGEEPGTTGQGGVWEPIGRCTGTAPPTGSTDIPGERPGDAGGCNLGATSRSPAALLVALGLLLALGGRRRRAR